MVMSSGIAADYNDQFEVKDVDKDGKKFDRGTSTSECEVDAMHGQVCWSCLIIHTLKSHSVENIRFVTNRKHGNDTRCQLWALPNATRWNLCSAIDVFYWKRAGRRETRSCVVCSAMARWGKRNVGWRIWICHVWQDLQTWWIEGWSGYHIVRWWWCALFCWDCEFAAESDVEMLMSPAGMTTWSYAACLQRTVTVGHCMYRSVASY